MPVILEAVMAVGGYRYSSKLALEIGEIMTARRLVPLQKAKSLLAYLEPRHLPFSKPSYRIK